MESRNAAKLLLFSLSYPFCLPPSLYNTGVKWVIEHEKEDEKEDDQDEEEE